MDDASSATDGEFWDDLDEKPEQPKRRPIRCLTKTFSEEYPESSTPTRSNVPQIK
jgi:hypothetical protein